MFWKSYRPAYRLYISSIRSRTSFSTMATLESIEQEIAQLTPLYQQLQKQKDDPAALEEARLKLGELKKSKGALMSTSGGGNKDKKKGRLLLKTPKVRTALRARVTPSSRYMRRVHATMAPERCSVVNISKRL